MKDFPMFDTEYGIASLVMKEIPYKGIAYIILREAWEPEKLLRECVSFCKMCGAERIFASGHENLECYPLHTSIVEMRGQAAVDREDLKSLFPVTEATVSQWRAIYNEKMRPVDNAATMTARDEKWILDSGGAYFVHDNGDLLGIGWLEDTTLLAVAAAKPGSGKTVMNTLMSLIEGAQMRLEVASTNEKAIHLYEKLGFFKINEVRRWYCADQACNTQTPVL